MTTITTTGMTTGMTEEKALLRLLAWLSPALPTGGFAYSHGLEWAVEAGDVSEESGLRSWLEDVLRLGTGRTESILLRHSWRAGSAIAKSCEEGAERLAELAELAALALATQPCRERRAEMIGMGTAFLAAAAAWTTAGPGSAIGGVLGKPEGSAGPTLLPPDLPYPVALGALCGMNGISEMAAVLGFLQSFAASLVSAALRLIPLGQSSGLRVLAGLEATIHAVLADTAGASLAELGGAAWRSEIAAMRHETQRVRLFRT